MLLFLINNIDIFQLLMIQSFQKGKTNMKIILASQSPRRKELLSLYCTQFEVMPSNAEEDMTQRMSIHELSENLSELKTKDVFEKTSGDRIVIGSDCMVYQGKKIFGKPKNDDDAIKMLKSLSGKWHKVITGLCVYVEKNGVLTKHITHDITKVKFKRLTNEMIEKYLATGEHKDKAGAYAVQGYSGAFVDKLYGNYSTVIGLPTHKLYDILKQENII